MQTWLKQRFNFCTGSVCCIHLGMDCIWKESLQTDRTQESDCYNTIWKLNKMQRKSDGSHRPWFPGGYKRLCFSQHAPHQINMIAAVHWGTESWGLRGCKIFFYPFTVSKDTTWLQMYTLKFREACVFLTKSYFYSTVKMFLIVTHKLVSLKDRTRLFDKEIGAVGRM